MSHLLPTVRECFRTGRTRLPNAVIFNQPATSVAVLLCEHFEAIVLLSQNLSLPLIVPNRVTFDDGTAIHMFSRLYILYEAYEYYYDYIGPDPQGVFVAFVRQFARVLIRVHNALRPSDVPELSRYMANQFADRMVLALDFIRDEYRQELQELEEQRKAAAAKIQSIARMRQAMQLLRRKREAATRI